MGEESEVVPIAENLNLSQEAYATTDAAPDANDDFQMADEALIDDEKTSLNKSFACESPCSNIELPIAEHTLKDENEIKSNTPVASITKAHSAPVSGSTRKSAIVPFQCNKSTGAMSANHKSDSKRPINYGFADTNKPVHFNATAGTSSGTSQRSQSEKRHQELYKAMRVWNPIKKAREFLKGVRLNKRFVLMMKHREDVDNKELNH